MTVKTSELTREVNRGYLQPILTVLFATVCLPLAATAATSGKSSAEKMLTAMVQPLFLAIVATFIVGALLTRREEKKLGWLLIVGAGILWPLSTQAVVSPVLKAWESSVVSHEPTSSEPLDYLIVLGGGTSVAPDGRAQFNLAGDRAGYAARLFLAGKAKHLITTGDNLTLSGTLSGKFLPEDDPSQQTKKIWMELGVPAEAISELSGQNTSSEIASLRAHPEYWENKRCAILTSAFHLPRAMQLAKQSGVSAELIAADYRSGRGPTTINQFVPESEELAKLHLVIKEWIGMQLGR